ncbi:hypothetical protein [Pseudoalteromonas rhizosphaerae]|uniref:hypothetical protein n=1 Tax=Pseudoalteromonas rhizosphaerae TaxID=2518973 RepID=UPI00237F5E61|nr:hypothetical protein [Pseudoalteromonas rhizosphaerae]
MKKLKNILATKRAKAGLLLTSTLGSASAFAADHTETINAAVADGTTNYTAIITGVITVAAVGFAIGMIIRQFNR